MEIENELYGKLRNMLLVKHQQELEELDHQFSASTPSMPPIARTRQSYYRKHLKKGEVEGSVLKAVNDFKTEFTTEEIRQHLRKTDPYISRRLKKSKSLSPALCKLHEKNKIDRRPVGDGTFMWKSKSVNAVA